MVFLASTKNGNFSMWRTGFSSRHWLLHELNIASILTHGQDPLWSFWPIIVLALVNGDLGFTFCVVACGMFDCSNLCTDCNVCLLFFRSLADWRKGARKRIDERKKIKSFQDQTMNKKVTWNSTIKITPKTLWVTCAPVSSAAIFLGGGKRYLATQRNGGGGE